MRGRPLEADCMVDFTPRPKTESFELKQTISKMICSSCAQEFTVADGATRCPYDNALLAPVLEDPFIGEVLSEKYEILSLLGVGGFAHVYKARHIALDRDVAIKILGAHLVSNMEAVKRFEHEAKIVSQLTHPNIVAVHDYGLVPQPYLVMEYLQGETLDDLIGGSPVQFDLALDILSQACDGIQAAHDLGAVHRDLKPSNVMLLRDVQGQITAKIVDFGVAKLTSDAMMSMSGLTRSGETMGSPPYMSPEQCQGRQPDRRSDIYSMGCLIYETLSGEQPFKGRNSVELMHKHLMQAPPEILRSHPNLKIPKAVEYIIITAMSKDPEDRYQNISELKEDLRAAASCSVKEFRQRLKGRKRRKKLNLLIPILGSTGLLLLAGAGTVYWYLQATPHNKPNSKLSDTDPRLQTMLASSESLLKQGGTQQAINICTNATRDFRDSAEAWRALAKAQLKYAYEYKATQNGVTPTRFYFETIKSSNEAIKIDPKNAEAYALRIKANCKIGKIDDAEKDIVQIDKSLPLSKLLRALILSTPKPAGNRAERQLELQKAKELLSEAVMSKLNDDEKVLAEEIKQVIQSDSGS